MPAVVTETSCTDDDYETEYSYDCDDFEDEDTDGLTDTTSPRSETHNESEDEDTDDEGGVIEIGSRIRRRIAQLHLDLENVLLKSKATHPRYSAQALALLRNGCLTGKDRPSVLEALMSCLESEEVWFIYDFIDR